MKCSLSRLAAASTLAFFAATGASANAATLDVSQYTAVAEDARLNFCSKDHYLVQAVVLPVKPKAQSVTPENVQNYVKGLADTLNKHISTRDKKDVGFPDGSFTFLKVQIGTYSQLFNAQNKTGLQSLFPRFYISEKPSALCNPVQAPKATP